MSDSQWSLHALQLQQELHQNAFFENYKPLQSPFPFINGLSPYNNPSPAMNSELSQFAKPVSSTKGEDAVVPKLSRSHRYSVFSQHPHSSSCSSSTQASSLQVSDAPKSLPPNFIPPALITLRSETISIPPGLNPFSIFPQPVSLSSPASLPQAPPSNPTANANPNANSETSKPSERDARRAKRKQRSLDISTVPDTSNIAKASENHSRRDSRPHKAHPRPNPNPNPNPTPNPQAVPPSIPPPLIIHTGNITRIKEDRKKKRLLRNRVSAQQARERKRQHIMELEQKCNQLESQNDILEKNLDDLAKENEDLRQIVKGNMKVSMESLSSVLQDESFSQSNIVSLTSAPESSTIQNQITRNSYSNNSMHGSSHIDGEGHGDGSLMYINKSNLYGKGLNCDFVNNNIPFSMFDNLNPNFQ